MFHKRHIFHLPKWCRETRMVHFFSTSSFYSQASRKSLRKALPSRPQSPCFQSLLFPASTGRTMGISRARTTLEHKNVLFFGILLPKRNSFVFFLYFHLPKQCWNAREVRSCILQAKMALENKRKRKEWRIFGGFNVYSQVLWKGLHGAPRQVPESCQFTMRMQ